MKITDITADILYVTPRGSLPEYKYGIKAPHISKQQALETHKEIVNPSLTEVSWESLKRQMGDTRQAKMELPQVEKVGQ